jgi:tetratricopeptide (TPR) repeat protein
MPHSKLLPLLALLVLSACRGLPPPSPEEHLRRELAQAVERYESDPDDEQATVWLGRWLGYAGRYEEAVAIFTRGLEVHPDSPWLLRFRGHRYITLRRFDDAAADLERADALAEGQPDEVEPDGQPNPAGVPIGSLRSNIDYHLGLAHYLRGDFEQALAVYERSAERARANPDRLVSHAYWKWLTLRQLGRDDEARAFLALLDLSVDVLENQAYRDLLRLFRGELGELELVRGVSPFSTEFPTRVYGLAMQRLLAGDLDGARARLGVSIDWGPPASFGRIAAEVELARL